MTKVSVIIPAYNAMNYLPQTVESLLKQSFTDFEVIIVNDGSSDGIEKWANTITDNRVKLISQKNQGTAVARNTGIADAEGAYIAFLDSDDLWEENLLEKQVHCLDNNPGVGLVYAWVKSIDAKGNDLGQIYGHDSEGYVWEKLLEGNIIWSGSAAMVRRDCFEKSGVFDANLKLAEDWEMWIRIAKNYSFAVIKEPLVSYRFHANNKSQNRIKGIDEFRLIIEKSFQSVPFELLYLRNKSYSRINFIFAWEYIRNQEPDYNKAEYFRNQALKHSPQLLFSEQNFRLTINIFFIRWFGTNGYGGIRKQWGKVRQFAGYFTR
ncbi:MAG: glycosyltransferase [Cyanobacteriota bacterium]|nr:glycosyltransferase [Cyanobacteriota bacterium]